MFSFMELYDECFWLFGGNVCEVDDEDCSFGDDVRGFGFKKDISGFFFFSIYWIIVEVFFFDMMFFFFLLRDIECFEEAWVMKDFVYLKDSLYIKYINIGFVGIKFLFEVEFCFILILLLDFVFCILYIL